MDQQERDNIIDGLGKRIRQLMEWHEQAWSAERFHEATLWAEDILRLTEQAREYHREAEK